VLLVRNERDNPNCAVERVVNAALDNAMNQAQLILLSKLKSTTLTDLALQFDQMCNKELYH
jgi:DNA-binding IscR family transcriptional regulator